MQTIVPKDRAHWLELRSENINSTEISALFGISPYMTPFELWHNKRDKLPGDFEPSERMIWGTRLQDAIAQGIAEDKGWKIRRMDEYIRDESLRAGSSFDFEIGDEGLLEIKNVDALQFRDKWLTDGDDLEAPPHIEMQVQHQLFISGRPFAYIAALVGGNSVKLIFREADKRIHKEIKSKVAWFWSTIERNEEPQPDFERDGETIKRLYSSANPGSVVDFTGNRAVNKLVERHKELTEMIKPLEVEKDAIKNELLTMIDGAEKVLLDNGTISAGVVAANVIESYTRKAYRNFRINHAKQKP